MKNNQDDLDELRQRAETKVPTSEQELRWPEDSQVLIHELRTHQIELELQNDELRRTEIELIEARDSFENLYDFSPVGYLTLSDKGYIQQANLKVADLLGMSRNKLIGQRLESLIFSKASDSWYLFFKGVLQRSDQRTCDFILKHSDGSSFDAQLDCRCVDLAGKKVVKITFTDISPRKQTERAQHELLVENRCLMRKLMYVQEEERRLLARDLHDELGQLLTSIDVRAEYIAKHADDAHLRAIAEEITRDTRASFDASKASLLELRPSTLDALGLVAALRELVGTWNQQAGIGCTLQIEDEMDQMGELHNITIYRLVQEGLTNAYRHGKADHVDVEVKKVLTHDVAFPYQAWVQIVDNGHGMNAQPTSKGMGIISMRERVNALDGQFSLRSTPEHGMCIEVSLPLINKQGDIL